MQITKLAETFKVDQNQAYKEVLGFSNANGVRILRTESELFDGAGKEVIDTIKRLSFMVKQLTGGSKVVPLDKECRLYFLYDRDVLVYVGKSTDILTRTSTHLKTKKFDSIETFIIPKDLIHTTELVNIYHYQPKLNISDKSGVLYLALILRNCVFEGFE